LYKTITISILSLFIVISIVLSPDIALKASLQGLSIWWHLVFPGLLPFLILYEMMTAFGLLHGINTLLSPLIKRSLKLPAEASMPLIISFFTGFPVGAEATANLLQQQKLTPKQAQRLLQYVHLPNPIFMIVIVGVGFLKSPLLGMLIALVVWISSFAFMLIHSRFIGKQQERIFNQKQPSFLTAIKIGRELDGRSLGKVLGDSVTTSVQKLFLIGGFMIFASVIAKLLEPSHYSFVKLLPFLSPSIFEHHIGSYAIAQWMLTNQEIMLGSALIVACLTFSGISGILQISYYVMQYPISLWRFVAFRIGQAIISFIALYALWNPLNWLLHKVYAAQSSPVITLDQRFTSIVTYTTENIPSIWTISLSLSIGLCIAIMLYMLFHYLFHVQKK